MKKWPRLSEFFALHPFSEDEPTPAGTLATDHQYAHWQKTKFDNTVRAWIAVPTFVACYFLWMNHTIPTFQPILVVFGSYAVLQFALNWIFIGSRYGRPSDFVLSGLDALSMSLAIYFTGAANSPLYFLYFIPLIVHAFHRDSAVVMFSGFGGVGLYAIMIFLSFSEINTGLISNLIARLFFMLLTVGVACLAIAVLKYKDKYHRQQVARLESQSRLSEMLNQVVILNDVEDVKKVLESVVTTGLGQSIQLDVRLTLDSTSPVVEALPIVQNHSGVSIPVNGSENESFGDLCVRCYVSHAFRREEMAFLRFVARSLGLAIQRILRMDELRKSLEMNSCVMAATIASVRSAEQTYRAVTEGIMTVLQVEAAELFLWSEALQVQRSVHRSGALTSVARQTIFPLKTLRGECLGEIRVERAASAPEFQPHNLEIAATFATRAALALENALVHSRERHDSIEHAA
jgi:hypothetical protein